MEPLCAAPPARWRSESQEIGSFYTFLKAEVERLKIAELEPSTHAMKQSNVILREVVSFNPRIQKMYFDHQRNKMTGKSEYPYSCRPSEPRLKFSSAWDSTVKPDSVSCDDSVVQSVASDSHFQLLNFVSAPQSDTDTDTVKDIRETYESAREADSNRGNAFELRSRPADFQPSSDNQQRDEVRAAAAAAMKTSRGSFLSYPQGDEVRVLALDALKEPPGSLYTPEHTSSSELSSSHDKHSDEVAAAVADLAAATSDSFGFGYSEEAQAAAAAPEPVRYRVPDPRTRRRVDNRRLDRTKAFREFSSNEYGKPDGISYKVERYKSRFGNHFYS